MNITGAFAAGMAGNAGGVMNANPFNPFLIAHSLYGPASGGKMNYIPGTDDEELHNLNTIDGGLGSADRSTMNNRHLEEAVKSGALLDDSNVDRSRTPNEGWNQSSNLREAIPSMQNMQNILGAPGNPIGIANQRRLNPVRRLNPGSMIERERDAWGKAKPLDERMRHFSEYLI